MNPLKAHRKLAMSLVLLLVGITLGGCSPYQLQGRVVVGSEQLITPVNVNDPRMQEEPLAGATIELTLDPSSISPKRLGTVVSDGNGDFTLDISAMGAGSFQEYDLGILITAPKHRNLWQTIKLPSAKKRLLVMMKKGAAGPPPPGDILKESLQLKDRFMGQ